MKKSLIALAALAATSAFAQSSVTLYGRAEAGVDLGYRETITGTASTSTVTAGVRGPVTTTATAGSVYKPGFRVQDGNASGQGTSRLGFRGTEDLGDGLKANFVMEMGVRIDEGCVNGGTGCTSGGSGGSQLFGRNAWVGLSGGFGEARLGRQVLGSFGVHANGLAGSASSGLYEPGANIVQGGVRFNNAIQYRSPDFGGISGTVSLSAPEAGNATTSVANANGGLVADTTNGTAVAPKGKTGVDLSVAYANGPIYVGFGFNRTSGSFATNNNEAALANIAAVGESKITDYAISASYNFGVAQPFFSYVNRKNVSTGSAVNAGVGSSGVLAALAPSQGISVASGAPGANTKGRQFTLGVKVPLGATTLIGSFGNLKTTGSGSTFNAAGAVTESNAVEAKTRAFNIGAQYPLSKRTMLQANYGINNTKTATANVTPTLATSTTGEVKIRSLNVGVQHNF
jgi:predicted porin